MQWLPRSQLFFFLLEWTAWYWFYLELEQNLMWTWVVSLSDFLKEAISAAYPEIDLCYILFIRIMFTQTMLAGDSADLVLNWNWYIKVTVKRPTSICVRVAAQGTFTKEDNLSTFFHCSQQVFVAQYNFL